MLQEILTAKVGPVLHFKNGNISLMCPVYLILIVIAAVVLIRFTRKRPMRKPPVRRSITN
jgi:cytochrome bd-type quinol oxidase subunit 1